MTENAPLDTAPDTPPGTPAQDAPTLDEVMPWSVAPLRLGRDWVLAPDPGSLRRRWTALIRTEDDAARAALFRPSRARTPHTAVAPLPGIPAPGTARLRDESGACPEPVRVLHGPYDQQWLIPDHRLLDAARPELWRVCDERQVHVVEAAADPRLPGERLSFTALLPDGHAPAGRIRPLYRQRGARDPNFAPGLLGLLTERLGVPVSAEDALAWIAAVGAREGREVPLTAEPELWERGVGLGRVVLWAHTRGERYGQPGEDRGRPRLPGGQRPYVRAPLDIGTRPEELRYEADEGALCFGETGRVSPVDRAAWEYEAGGVRVVEAWFAERVAARDAGTLAAVRPGEWPREWTSELLELITVLTLLARLREDRRALAASVRASATLTSTALREAGVLPPPAASRAPASVLDLEEEGPEGQLTLL